MATRKRTVSLQMIINGQPVTVLGELAKPLKHARDLALTTSGNTGRNLDDWQVRDVQGVLLENYRVLRDFGFADGTRLFVSPAVGIGGSGKLAA